MGARVWTFISKQFQYERGSLVDGVRLLDKRPYRGDCDDFAWTVLVLLAGSVEGALRMLDRGDAEIWRVKSPQNNILPRHVALYVRDEDKGWIDSTNRVWRETPRPHKKVYKITQASLFAGTVWGTIFG
jgi:hypothetical protein